MGKRTSQFPRLPKHEIGPITGHECIASWRYALLKGRRTNELQVTLAGHALGCALLGRAGNVQHRRLQSRRWRKPRHLENLDLV
jgi:hypothetical protein